ncbi:hypothetical protein N7527_009029 [Penicillium freii]|jgi:hypothetical protein
MSSG